ncbi:hypothetical protein KFE98_15175 [bacterium SCSIO 12741]|nr:hypothetical protein KFE98_15175 [bacterium SCSIO 12741]
MDKKKLTALIIISVTFFLTFYFAFLNFSLSTQFTSLFAFLILLAGTVTSLVIGNAGER